MNKLSMSIWTVVLLLFTGRVHSHGRLWEPPSRSSMWRRGYNTTVNINDNELNCGGFQNQWITYGGLCGVCGDPYQQHPRENEAGGKYASGLITRLYRTGEEIDVTIDLTANHGGYFEFRLCPINKQNRYETQDCFERYPLLIRDITGEDFQYRIKDRTMQGHMDLLVRLPPKLTCTHCVLQWRYWTGSRWGCEQGDICGKGIGHQEEFYGCSDIAISSPSAYTTYLPLVAKPLNYIIANYSVLNEDKLTKQPDKLNDVAVDIVLSEFVEGRKEEVPIRIEHPKLKHRQEPHVGKIVHKTESNPIASVNKELAQQLQKITVDTILNYYKRKGQLMIDGDRTCIATGRFRDNPIIQEWCSRGCPGLSMDCPVKMCSCQRNRRRQKAVQFVKLPHFQTELRDKVPMEMNNFLFNSDPFSRNRNTNQNNFIAINDKMPQEMNTILFNSDPHSARIDTNAKRIFDNERIPKKMNTVLFKTNHYSTKMDNTPIELFAQNQFTKAGRKPYPQTYMPNIYPGAVNGPPPLMHKVARWPIPAEFNRFTHFPMKIKSKPVNVYSPRSHKEGNLLRSPLVRRWKPFFHITQRRRRVLPQRRLSRYDSHPQPMKGVTFYASKPQYQVKVPPKTMFVISKATKPKHETQPILQQIPEGQVKTKALSRDKKYAPVPQVSPKSIVCSASAIFGHVKSMIKWCQKNCLFGFCPPSVCRCL